MTHRPRWLYSVGKGDQAKRILAKYHSSTNDPDSPLIQLEMKEIEEKIQIDGADSTCIKAGYTIVYDSYPRNRNLVGLQTFVQNPSG